MINAMLQNLLLIIALLEIVKHGMVPQVMKNHLITKIPVHTLVSSKKKSENFFSVPPQTAKLL